MLVIIVGIVFYIYYFTHYRVNILHILHDFTKDIIKLIKLVIIFSIHAAHWVGRCFVVLIFIGSAISLINNISIALEINFLDPAGNIFKLTKLFEIQSTWAAATAVVGTTVALGHFRNADFVRENKVKN